MTLKPVTEVGGITGFKGFDKIGRKTVAVFLVKPGLTRARRRGSSMKRILPANELKLGKRDCQARLKNLEERQLPHPHTSNALNQWPS